MRVWSISDVGSMRKENQDAVLVDELEKAGQAFFAICDGMGGANAGNVASRTAIDAFAQAVRAGLKPNMSAETMKKIVRNAAAAANEAVLDTAASRPECEGMGTTLVGALVSGDQVVIGNVGDSRAYLLDEDGIRQITRDHSLVSELVLSGSLSHEQAQRHPSKNVITRALGAEKDVSCDVFPLTLRPGQYILLCSDGLTGEVSEPEIYYEICQSGKPELACDTLVNIANARGGRDNITIVIASF